MYTVQAHAHTMPTKHLARQHRSQTTIMYDHMHANEGHWFAALHIWSLLLVQGVTLCRAWDNVSINTGLDLGITGEKGAFSDLNVYHDLTMQRLVINS